MRHVRSEQRDSSGEPAGTRDSWCTPAWLAEAVGGWDLDPCSNPRSHVKATTRLMLEQGDDGLRDPLAHAGPDDRVFVNPPYSRGQVARWFAAYEHTRWCFLLRFDPSTEWFHDVYERAELIAIPRGRRVNFEPPPGVKASSNVYPHALFYRRQSDATTAVLKLCVAWRKRSRS